MHNVRIANKRVLLTDAEIKELDQFRGSEKHALVLAIERNTDNLAETRRAFDDAGLRFLETIPEVIS